MFSAKKIKKYKQLIPQALTQPKVETALANSFLFETYKKSNLQPTESEVEMKLQPIPVLLIFLKKYLTWSTRKTHVHVVESLIKILEEKPGQVDNRLNNVFKQLSHELNKETPLKIQGDFFSLWLVFFRGYPQFISQVKPDGHGIYALLILGVFFHAAYGNEYKNDEHDHLLLNLDYVSRSAQWAKSFLKRLIQVMSPVLLEEIIQALHSCRPSIMSFSKKKSYSKELLSLLRLLIQHDALTVAQRKQISAILSQGIDIEFKEKSRHYMAAYKEFYLRFSDLSLTQQRQVFQEDIALRGLLRYMRQLNSEYSIQSMVEIVSKMDITLLHESLEKILIHFEDLIDKNAMSARQVHLLKELVYRFVPDNVVCPTLPAILLPYLTLLQDSYYTGIDKAFHDRLIIFAAIARSTQASLYFNLEHQCNLLDTIKNQNNFFNSSGIKEISDALANHLSDEVLKFFLRNLTVELSSLSQTDFYIILELNVSLIMLNSFVPFINEKLIEPSLIFSLTSTAKRLLKSRNNLAVHLSLICINALITFKCEKKIDEPTKNVIIEKFNFDKMKDPSSECFGFLSLNPATGKDAFSSPPLDLIPAFFQILSEPQQKQLLGYLLAGFKDDAFGQSRRRIGNTLAAIMRQYPHYADAIFNDITNYLQVLLACPPIIDQCAGLNTFAPFSYVSEDLLLSIGSFCGERAMLACEAIRPQSLPKTKIEQLFLLVKNLNLFPDALVSLILDFIYPLYKPTEQEVQKCWEKGKKPDEIVEEDFVPSLSFSSNSSSSTSMNSMTSNTIQAAPLQPRSRSLSLGALTARSLTEGILMTKGKLENKLEVTSKRRHSANF